MTTMVKFNIFFRLLLQYLILIILPTKIDHLHHARKKHNYVCLVCSWRSGRYVSYLMVMFGESQTIDGINVTFANDILMGERVVNNRKGANIIKVTILKYGHL